MVPRRKLVGPRPGGGPATPGMAHAMCQPQLLRVGAPSAQQLAVIGVKSAKNRGDKTAAGFVQGSQGRGEHTFCSSDAMRVLRRCPMRSSLKRQLRLLLSKSSTGCRRLHCWQKRSCSPSCMTTGALAWKSQIRYRKLRVFMLATDSLQPWTLHIGSFLFFRGLRVFAPGCSAAAGTGGGNGFGGPVSAFLVVRAGAVVPRALRRRLAVTGFSSILAVLDLAGGCGDCGGDCCGGSPERGLSSAVKSPEPIAEFVYYISARGRYGSTPRPAGARLRRNDPSTLLAGVLKAVAASEIIFAAVVVARSSDHCLGSLRASCPARRAFNS